MISPLAFVDPTAKIGDNVTIYPFAYVDKDVEIGDGCIVMPNASIMQGARLGKNVKVYNNAIVSASPQDFRWKGETSYVIIGDNTVIREMAIINRSIHEGGATKVGATRLCLRIRTSVTTARSATIAWLATTCRLLEMCLSTLARFFPPA